MTAIITLDRLFLTCHTWGSILCWPRLYMCYALWQQLQGILAEVILVMGEGLFNDHYQLKFVHRTSTVTKLLWLNSRMYWMTDSGTHTHHQFVNSYTFLSIFYFSFNLFYFILFLIDHLCPCLFILCYIYITVCSLFIVIVLMYAPYSPSQIPGWCKTLLGN